MYPPRQFKVIYVVEVEFLSSAAIIAKCFKEPWRFWGSDNCIQFYQVQENVHRLTVNDKT